MQAKNQIMFVWSQCVGEESDYVCLESMFGRRIRLIWFGVNVKVKNQIMFV